MVYWYYDAPVPLSHLARMRLSHTDGICSIEFGVIKSRATKSRAGRIAGVDYEWASMKRLFSKPGAIEDPEVSDGGTREVVLAMGGDTRAEIQGRTALPGPRDVILLALDGHDRWTPYISEPHSAVARNQAEHARPMPEALARPDPRRRRRPHQR